jgi:hypothetical protein
VIHEPSTLDTVRKAKRAESETEKLHRRWHEWLYLWFFCATIFVLVLVVDALMVCRAGNDESTGVRKWSWLPLGNGCQQDDGTTHGPGPTLTFIAIGFIAWAIALVVTRRHAFKPARHGGSERS